MARANVPLHTFNRGRVSRLALARTDLERVRISAEVQTNWMPRSLGSMMLRPGLQFIDTTCDNKKARIVPFVFSSSDTALLEVADCSVKARIDDVLVERPGSTATVTNGTFTSTDISAWTDADESGSTSEWVSGGYLGLTGTRFSRAVRRHEVTSASGTHGLAVSIFRGKPTIKVGSSSAGDDYVAETELREGDYSFKVASTGNFHIELSANTEYTTLVDSVTVESSGPMTLPAPWLEDDLGRLRFEQSGDVVFVSAFGYRQRRIERRATESWAVVQYNTEDGPFRNINITNKRLTPSGLTGNITLACDQPLFKSGNVGSLYEITSVGQEVEATFTDDDQSSDSIRVTGVDDTRKFDILVSSHGSTQNTVRVQRSIGEEGNWANVSGLAFTSTTSQTHDDTLDNQIAFYRLATGSTDFGSTANTITASLSYAAGGISGVARVTGVPASTESTAIVLEAFGSTDSSELWSEGDWSDLRGFPSAVILHEGRLCWAGKGKFWASVSDGFESFDNDVEGDSGPLNLSIGSGPVDIVEWLLSLNRLVLGSQGAEVQAKTSSLEEPLTPTNFALRDISTQGSASVQGAKVDKRAFFVQAGGTRVMEIAVSANSLDFETLDRTIHVPEMGEPGIVRMGVQRQPDTRLHCVRSDGTVALLVTDPAENVLAWIDIETGDADNVDGVIEDVAVLPGDVEDQVYYLVKRVVNGGAVRYIEKWAKESEARGGALNKIADSFVVQNSTLTTTMTGLDHLVGKDVVVWGNGKDLGSYTVSTTGTVTGLAEASTTTIAGLAYSSLFKSAKLAFIADAGTPLTQRKRVDHIGLILADTHARGLEYGPSTSVLEPLPVIEDGRAISSDSIWTDYDKDSIEFPGEWNVDSRVILYGEAPRPVTVLGAVITHQTKDKI